MTPQYEAVSRLAQRIADIEALMRTGKWEWKGGIAMGAILPQLRSAVEKARREAIELEVELRRQTLVADDERLAAPGGASVAILMGFGAGLVLSAVVLSLT